LAYARYRECVVALGGFDFVVAENTVRRDTVEAFVAWLQSEVKRDEEGALEPKRPPGRSGMRRPGWAPWKRLGLQPFRRRIDESQ